MDLSLEMRTGQSPGLRCRLKCRLLGLNPHAPTSCEALGSPSLSFLAWQWWGPGVGLVRGHPFAETEPLHWVEAAEGRDCSRRSVGVGLFHRSLIHPFIQDTPPALWSCTHRGVQKWLHSLEGLPGKINPGEGELLEPLEGSLPKPGISGRPQGDTCKVEMVQSLLEDLICMRTLMWASS